MSARDGHLRLERKQKDMADKVKEGKVRCSFCHKTEDQVRKLIAGPDGAYICDECRIPGILMRPDSAAFSG